MSALIEGPSCITKVTSHIPASLSPSFPLPPSSSLSLPLSLPPSLPLSLSPSPSPQVVHPSGAITQFLQFFGAHIFILWKLALLKKRVLIYSPPPIGVVCYRGRPHPLKTL